MTPPTVELLEWEQKQEHYQRPAVVSEYDNRRFKGGVHGPAAERKWRMITRAVAGIPNIRSVLDMPCGTGRFTTRILERGWKLVNGDLSAPMLDRTLSYCADHGTHLGSARLDAKRLPFKDQSVDLVLCIRFLMHAPASQRITIMRELGRVGRYVVLDVRHKYCLNRYLKKLRRALGASVKIDEPRLSMNELRAETDAAGLRILRKVWHGRPFSQKLVLLCERADQTSVTNSLPGLANR